MIGLSDQNKQLAAWCALWRAPGVGVHTFAKILTAFTSPLDFFAASDADCRKRLPHLAEPKLRQWRESFANEAFLPDIEWLVKDAQHHIITYLDAAYPPLLKKIPDAPPLLYVLGDVALLQSAQIAVVGSRNATPVACELTTAITQQLARSHLTITSGLALGIDGVAHRAALDAGGTTIAVVATGLDKVYPARHYALAHEIAEHGALVSEFPIGTGVRQGYFPRRNRVISGLSLGVFVAEASIKSGSLITARQAGEQGREVFAMPGSVNNPLARGCHQLIREGAKLVESAEDILEELLPLARAELELQSPPPEAAQAPAATPPLADEDAEALNELLTAMGYDPCRIDDLVARSQLTSEQISAMLLVLELDGRVVRLPGGRFQQTTTQ